jgi:large subunit ribosomal protein L4
MAALNAPVLGATTKAKLDPGTFGVERNDGLVHQVVTAELAARRQGTHATKTRGMVAGGRSKPWRQKGTGRARAGTTRAAQWTGGGVVFGPSPRNYTGKVNRKAHRKALQIALSAHAAGGTLAAVDAGSFKEPKTRQAAELIAGWHDRGPLVVVVTGDEDTAARSFRNLERTHVVEVSGLEVADLVWARRVVVSKAALKALEGSES